MRNLTDKEAEVVFGGSSTISGTVINAFVNVIKLVYEAGKGLGSAIRRLSEEKMCPLE